MCCIPHGFSSFQKEENENTTDFGGHPQLKVVPTLIKT